MDALALLTDSRQLLVQVCASLAAAGQVRWQPAIELLLNDPN